MYEERDAEEVVPNKNPLYHLDRLIQRLIPNFNARAILYLSLIFLVAMSVQVWRITAPKPEIQSTPVLVAPQETVIADGKYWDSKEYKEKIHNQTVESFTHELESWLQGKDQEFSRRTFEDMVFINGGLTPDVGGDLAVSVPESFNYLENNARNRYRYAKDKGFLSDTPTLVKLGSLVCDSAEKTEKVTGIELYDWRYTSMPKLAAFMKTNPDWKTQVGDRIFDISDPRTENKEVLALRDTQTQPAGLFSFLIVRNPENNRIALADSTILEKNGVDAALTLSRIDAHWDKQPKIYFRVGYEGCKHMNIPQIQYGHSD